MTTLHPGQFQGKLADCMQWLRQVQFAVHEPFGKDFFQQLVVDLQQTKVCSDVVGVLKHAPGP